MNQEVARQPEIIQLSEHGSNPGAGAIAAIEGSRAMQEVTASILAAKRFPRDELRAYKDILAACDRSGLAEKAVYTYKRGGTTVTGCSIRLAEVAARCWGNLDYSWQELERVGTKSTVRAVCWDMQTNMRAGITFTVMQVRDKWEKIQGQPDRKIQVPLTDERDIYENNANHAARRKRACILALIPGDIIEDAIEQCKKTLAISAPVTPETLKALLAAYATFNVNKHMLEAFIGRNYETIEPAQMVKFRTMFAALKDGVAVVDDFFDTDLADKAPEPKKDPDAKPEAKPDAKPEEAKDSRSELEKFKDKHLDTNDKKGDEAKKTPSDKPEPKADGKLV